MNDITLILGPQGSGKSTYVKEYVDQGHIRLNRDTEGGTMAGLLGKMKTIMKTGKSVVLDNVFATVADRQPFIEAAKAEGYKVNGVFIGTSIEDCMYNVCQRMIRAHGKLLSPDEIKKSKDPGVFPPAVLYKYRKSAQIPRTEEGFDKLEFTKFTRIIEPEYKNKAVILDKDGTLAECISGAKYPVDPSDIRILKGRVEKLIELKKQGYKLLGVSNQSGVAKGELNLTQLVRVFNKTNELLKHDIDWNYCPHRIPPVSCYCRKPGVGLSVLLIETHKLNPSQCIMIGDMTTDKTFAKRSGFQYEDAASFFK